MFEKGHWMPWGGWSWGGDQSRGEETEGDAWEVGLAQKKGSVHSQHRGEIERTQ